MASDLLKKLLGIPDELFVLLKKLEEHPVAAQYIFDTSTMNQGTRSLVLGSNDIKKFYFIDSQHPNAQNALPRELLSIKRQIDYLVRNHLIDAGGRYCKPMEGQMAEKGYPIKPYYTPGYVGAASGVRIQLKDAEYIVH